MRNLFLIACFSVGWILAGIKPVKSQTGFSTSSPEYLVVRRTEIVTNVLPATRIEDWSGYGSFLWRKIPETNYVTNLIIGSLNKDLFRAQAME